jgi:hypothetical protein
MAMLQFRMLQFIRELTDVDHHSRPVPLWIALKARRVARYVMAEAFFSKALGDEYEYRAWFSDKVGLVILAKSGRAGDLHCRKQGDSGPYQNVYHSAPQVKQVLLDCDTVELGP